MRQRWEEGEEEDSPNSPVAQVEEAHHSQNSMRKSWTYDCRLVVILTHSQSEVPGDSQHTSFCCSSCWPYSLGMSWGRGEESGEIEH